MTVGVIIAGRISQNLADIPAALAQFRSTIPFASAWVQRDWILHQNNPAFILLNGTKLSLLEAGTAWAVGSNRGAAASLRVSIENAMSWLYYKDHPVEFGAVTDRRLDLMLPKAVQQYLKSVDGGFESAYEMLKKTKSRNSEYYYTDISQFVHAHPRFANVSDIETAAISYPRDPSFLSICAQADEFISDNYLAFYRLSWGDFPALLQDHLSLRLGDNISKFVE